MDGSSPWRAARPPRARFRRALPCAPRRRRATPKPMRLKPLPRLHRSSAAVARKRGLARRGQPCIQGRRPRRGGDALRDWVRLDQAAADFCQDVHGTRGRALPRAAAAAGAADEGRLARRRRARRLGRAAGRRLAARGVGLAASAPGVHPHYGITAVSTPACSARRGGSTPYRRLKQHVVICALQQSI